MSASISNHLERIRTIILKGDAQVLAWWLYSLALGIATLAIGLESIFYFAPAVRWGAVVFLGILSLLGIGAGSLLLWLSRRNRIPRYTYTRLARKAGRVLFAKPDTLVNALQLERSLSSSLAPGLNQAYIRQVDREMQGKALEALLPRDRIRRWKTVNLGLLLLLVVLILTRWTASSAALYRWVHPRTVFPVPQPFHLYSASGNLNLLGGSDAVLVSQAVDAQPDTVYYELSSTTPAPEEGLPGSPRIKMVAVAPDSAGLYTLTLREVTHDYVYRAFVPARRFWQPWKEISSPAYTISVTDRPILEAFTVTILPPRYSGLDPQIQEGNQAGVRGLKGSRIGIRLRSNRPLAAGSIHLNDQQLPLSVHDRQADGEFVLLQDGQFTIHLQDSRGIGNRDPITYHLQVIPDLYPELQIIVPEPILELGDDLSIPLHLSIEDDFGFSNLSIGFEVRRPAYIDSEPYTAMLPLPELVPGEHSQEIFSHWDLSQLDLMPEDEVRYHFELYDNDDVSGPKKTASATYIARLPSLADLFTTLETAEQKLVDDLETDAAGLQSLHEQLDKLQLELLKNETVDWERQQALQKTLERVQEQVKQLQSLAENLETLSATADKHGLFSESLRDKFRQLQELVNDIITPDLLKNMEHLSQALEKLDSDQILSALERLNENVGQLESQLDRFIDIFERIRAEQKMDEVLKRMQQLVDQQTRLDQELQREDQAQEAATQARLAQEEQRHWEEFEHIRKTMDQAAQQVRPFSPSSSETLQEMSRSELARQTSQQLQEAAENLKRSQSQAARENSRQALENLQELRNRLLDLQQQFQNETVQAMAARFQKLMRDLLTLSKAQENLQGTTSLTPPNSPRLGNLAAHQQMLRDQLLQVMSALMELSRETFAVTPEIGKSVGSAYGHMETAKQQLAQRQGTGARNSQSSAVQSLNESVLAVQQAVQQMQQAGSASGFEQYLQRMQQMSAQQQGLNQQGLQLLLGQMAANAQNELLQRLLSGQQQVRKSLQQLQRELQQSGRQGLGDLGGIAEEMDAVIKDLQRKAFNRKSVDRQQRILSRMLDSQKSLTRRDFKPERQSTTAEPVAYAGPGGLPADLGQRRSLALEALNQALKSGYSRDYQDMIRRYFNSLAQSGETLPREESRP